MTHPFSRAGTATAFGIHPSVGPDPVGEVGVGLSKLVASLAMRLGKVLGLNRVPSQRVNSHADRLQVRGVDARAIPTQMVSDESVGNGAAGKFVRKSGSPDLPATLICPASDVETTVAVLVEREQPRPTAVGVRLSSMGMEAVFVGE